MCTTMTRDRAILTMLEVLMSRTPPHAVTQRHGVEVWRGTSGPTELLWNVQAHTTRFHGLRVHAGFVKAYEAAAPPATCESRVIGGYSLGGALALLRAVDLAATGRTPPPRVVTLGCPKFICPASIGALHTLLSPTTHVERVVYSRDPITRVPTHLSHYGERISLDYLEHVLPHVRPSPFRNPVRHHLLSTYKALLLASPEW